MRVDGSIDENVSATPWTTTIGELCDRFGGEVQTGPFGSQLHASDYSTEGTPVVMPQDMNEGRIVCDRVARVGPRHVSQLKRHALRTGDIVYSRRGDVTRFAVVTEAEDGWLCGTGSIRIRLNSPDIFVGYVRRYLQQESVGSWLKHHAKGVTMPNLNTQVIRALPFVYPPLAEQRRIAEILDKADALRAKRRAALAHLDTLTKSIFFDMFGDPATNPKGWPWFSLGALLRGVTNGMARRRAESDRGQSIVLRLRDIRDGWIDFSDVNRITLTADEGSKYEVLDGDLLFIRVNGNPDYVGRCALFEGHAESVYFNDHVMRVRVDRSCVSGVFLTFLLNGAHGKSEIAKHRKTSAGQHTINQDGLDRIRLPLPPLPVQADFARRIAAVEKSKTNYTTSLGDLDALFASLQHRAFQGEL